MLFHLVDSSLGNRLRRIFKQNSYIFDYAFENVCKNQAIMPRPHCVKNLNIICYIQKNVAETYNTFVPFDLASRLETQVSYT